MVEINPYWQNHIGGQWVDGDAGRLPIENPATGDVIAEQALAGPRDIDRAVAAARACHQSGALANVRPIERGRIIRAMGDYLLDHKSEIAIVLTLESGKPLWEAKLEIEGAARYFEYYGSQAETLEGRSIPLGTAYIDFTTYEPYGVSAHIVPWNYPVEMTARSLSAALAAGNACVVKSPELDPLACSYIAKAAEHAGLPDGAVNIVCGIGHTAGASLSSHPDIDQIVFTGSVETGVAIASAAARNVVPGVLELGGKSAAIVAEDADVDSLMADVRWGIFFNAGQVCSAMSRLIVPKSLVGEVTDRVVDLAKSLSVGPGLDRVEFGMNMGAVISDIQRDRIDGFCLRAESEGAQVAAGGRKLNRPGCFFEPTILMNVSPEMEVAREEVFGPVLTILSCGSDDDAIEIANSGDYGLVAGIFTSDIDRAMRASQRLRAGQIFVNEWYAGGVETPFGGYGKSGYGREKGREALWNYVQTKNVAIRVR